MPANRASAQPWKLPLQLGQLGPSGRGAGQADGHHVGLSAGTGEPQLVCRGEELEDEFGELDLLGAGAAAVAAPGHLLLHRLHHVRVGVTQDRGPVTRYVADVLVAVDVPLAGAAEPVHVEGEGGEHPSVVGHAVGEEPPGLFGQRLRLGTGLDVLFKQ